ncbi:MAG: molybdopterin-dependent oxidoreductase [Chloroflexi bacterium]|nr:molybdopterin-dependent oxidoreductase [Chloroflexota bacterium]
MAAKSAQAQDEVKIVNTACNSHCGGSCILRVHIKNGTITHIETDNGEEPQYRACLRCRAYRQRVYHPERLLYPLKRVGERGEGKFQRVSWDEALDKVASEIKRVRRSYGPQALMLYGLGGDVSWLQGWRSVDVLLCMMGGYSPAWGVPSFEAGNFATMATFGSFNTRHTRDDLLNSKLIIMWGWDPANSIQDTNTSWFVARAREKGARVVVVDPRHTESAATLGDQWVPILPGTDAAALIAMAYVIVTEKLQDQSFIDKYTSGFGRYRDYLLGKEDGVAKTPQWAEKITGVPAQTIADLAREYARSKPAALIGGISPGRTAIGEQYHRAAMVLPAITGNIGIHGGDPGGRNWTGLLSFPFLKLGRGMYSGPNKVEEALAPRKYALVTKGFHVAGHIHFNKIPYAILEGKAGGYDADIKLLYTINTNYLNQHPNINMIVKALKKLEFFVVHEQFMTATAKFADVILPSNTFLERNDITTGEGVPHISFMKQVIDSVGESKSHVEIAAALANKLGVEGYGENRTQEEWCREIVKPSIVPDFEKFKEKAFYRVPLPEPYVAFREEIKDPEKHPFRTPSGKIEIYSQRLAEFNNPRMPALPMYLDDWDGPQSAKAKKYPLSMVSSHCKTRALSQNDLVPWMRELYRQSVAMNSADAAARGIKNGDLVRVFNDIGEMAIPARVTERIMPGVVDIPQGGWYQPDEKGVDRGGCVNTVTPDEPSPGGALASNGVLVQVEKWEASSGR